MMKSVGQILREAREAKGLTVAQAAEGTRSKSQTILALEQDDFSKFPAPIYTRGFIKLYAEFLGLDAPGLISLFQARNADADKLHRPASVLKPGAAHPPPPPAAVTPELDLPPPAPAIPAPASPPGVVAPPKVEAPEPELPFDRPAPRPAPPLEPPKLAPKLPEAPKQPVSQPVPVSFPAFAPPAPPPVATPAPAPAPVSAPEPAPIAAPIAAPAPPRRKASAVKPAPKAGSSDEFALDVRESVTSQTARDRAASIFALARASAVSLPWTRILPRAGAVAGILLLAWLLLTVSRGCMLRHAARTAPPAEATVTPPRGLPEPPPLYFPGKLK